MLRALAIVCVLAGTASADPAYTDTRCPTPPRVKAKGFRHKRVKLYAKTMSPLHRGLDLVASEDDKTQLIEGKLAYGKFDKDAEDEDAEVFACIDGAWKSMGVARTDDDGRFTIGTHERLPVGMRDMYVAALGDGAGAYFIAYVAPRGTSIAVTDIDGTISWSENAIIKTVIDRAHDIAHRPDAPEALAALPYPVVYTTARGDVLAGVTRAWLERHGFPRGPLRLAKGLFAKPGSSAIAYKTATLKSLTVPIAIGIGNRKSDITAYTSAGLAAKKIFIHLPEYAKELKADLDAGRAIGFADYAKLKDLVAP